jgi:23S rRNA (uracil1939-C5)-methyltransferase
MARTVKRRKSPPVRGSEVELEATITELAPGGKGVAVVTLGADRRAVFVRGAASGDRVKLLVDTRSRPARGRILQLLSASPTRVASPPCAWVDACGACDWMHVAPEGQRAAHEAHVRAALPAGARDAVPLTVHPSPTPLGYRTRARVHARASGGRAIVGMNEAGTREPAEVDSCVILHPQLESARRRLEALFEGAHGRGEIQLGLGAARGEERPAVLDVRWDNHLPGSFYGRVEGAVRDGWLAGAQVTAGEARVPARIGDPTPWMLAGDGLPLRLAPGGFGQASDDGNGALARRVASLARTATTAKPDARVLELYAGAGNFTVLLAALGSPVTAVESSPESCEAARSNLLSRGLAAKAKIVAADASSFAIPAGTHLVILDPPRTGAREAVTRIVASSVRHVLYVSCDTQTLARDLAVLEPSFAPASVDVFELFAQTSHVEVVVHLVRTARPGRS